MSAVDKNKNPGTPTPVIQSQPEPKPKKSDKVTVDRRAKSLRLVSVSTTIFFIVIVLIFNLVFDSLLGTTLQWDWSTTQMYTLGDVSKTIAGDLQNDIRVVALFERENLGTNYNDVLLLLDQYTPASNGRVKVEYVDPVKVPGIIKELDPAGLLKPVAGDFVFKDLKTGKVKKVTLEDLYSQVFDETTYSYKVTGMTAEEAFSGAIKYVSAEMTPVVYFATGHDEAAYDTEYANFTSILQDNNFDTKVLDLRTQSTIPEDAAMVAFLQPRIDISSKEGDILRAYLKKGGRILMIAGFTTTPLPEINKVLVDFNVAITEDRVRESDLDRRFQEDPYTFIAEVPASVVASQAFQLILGNARRIEDLKNAKEWITSASILTTSTGGVAEVGGDTGKSSEPGTQIIGQAVENKGWMTPGIKSAKVVVLGSSQLVSDAMLTSLGSYSQYNQYFIYFTMQWLVDVSQNDLLITAKPIPSYTLNAGTQTSRVLAAVLVVLIVPGGLLLAALFVFRRRRHM